MSLTIMLCRRTVEVLKYHEDVMRVKMAQIVDRGCCEEMFWELFSLVLRPSVDGL